MLSRRGNRSCVGVAGLDGRQANLCGMCRDDEEGCLGQPASPVMKK